VHHTGYRRVGFPHAYSSSINICRVSIIVSVMARAERYNEEVLSLFNLLLDHTWTVIIFPINPMQYQKGETILSIFTACGANNVYTHNSHSEIPFCIGHKSVVLVKLSSSYTSVKLYSMFVANSVEILFIYRAV
jgi:hypothetical protein